MKPEDQDILRQRAKELAFEIIEPIKEESIDVLEFMSGEEYYAIDSLYIKEVYSIRELTQIPFTPDYILGVINIRGEIFSVIDFKILFNSKPQIINEKNKAIVVKNNDMEFSLLTEKIIGIKSLKKSDIFDTPLTLNELQSEYISGVTKDGLIIINIDKMLSDEKMIVHQEI